MQSSPDSITIMGLFRAFNPRVLIAVFAAAFLLRAGFLILHDRPLFSDETEYHELAASLATKDSYQLHGQPTAYRPVGYPFVLSLVYRVSSQPVQAARIVQALIDSLTCVLLMALAGRMSVRHGLIAGVAWAVFPPAIVYSTMLLSETLSVFGIVLLAFFFITDTTSTLRTVLFAFLAGLLILLKPFLLLFALILLLAHSRFRLSRVHVIAFALALLATILPWAVRNSFVVHEFTLSTNGGMNLFIGNNPDATGGYSGHFPEELSDPRLDEAGRDHKAMIMAVEFIVHHPGQFVVNGAKKIGQLLRGESELAVLAFHPNPTDASTRFAEKYRSLSWYTPLILTLPVFLVMIAGLLGLISSERDRFFWYVGLLLLSVCLVHVVFFGGSRFHFLFMPFAIVFASGPAFALRPTLRSLGLRQITLFSVLSIFLLTIWTYEFVYLAIR